MAKELSDVSVGVLLSVLTDHPDSDQVILGELLFNEVEMDVADKVCEYLDNWYGLYDLDAEMPGVDWTDSKYNLKNVAREIVRRSSKDVKKELSSRLEKTSVELVYVTLMGYTIK